MSTWEAIEPIFTNLREIINQNVPALSDATYSFVAPFLLAADEPEIPQIRRIIMGAKSYEGMSFPQCHIIPVELKFDTVAFNTEEMGLNYRIVSIHQDASSAWGGSFKNMKLSADIKDALYKAMGGMKTRTLGGVCNDIFVTGITWETEPLKTASVHWNNIQVLVRKRITAIQ